MKRSQDADVHTIKIGKERLAQAAQLPAQPYSLYASKTIIFDTETTGLNPREDEIIQISIIDGLGNVLINELVHPYWKKSWSEAARVNGITPDRVANAPYPHELIPKVKGIFAAADLLVAYNNQFDLNFLEQWGIQTTGKKQYDVMMAFAREYGEWNDFFCDYKWQKLGTAAAYYGYHFRAHDSLEDVRATLYIFEQMHTGFSSVPPVGPAIPVVLAPMSASARFFTPSAICKAVSADTAPSVLSVSSLTPSTLCLILFAYEQTPQSNTSLAPLTAVILPESKPPVQLSAVASLRFFFLSFSTTIFCSSSGLIFSSLKIFSKSSAVYVSIVRLPFI